MLDREKELLNCFRQLPPEDQVAVLSHVRIAARVAEYSVKKMPAMIAPVNSGSGMEQKRGKTAQG